MAGGGVHFNVTGDADLKKLFQQLPKKFENNAVRAIARAAAAPMVKAARQKVPKRSGALKRAIGVQSIRRAAAVKVTVRRKYIDTAEGTKVPVQYAKHLAFGKKNRKKRGRVKNPIGDFIQEGARAARGESKKIMLDKSRKIVARQIEKYKASRR